MLRHGDQVGKVNSPVAVDIGDQNIKSKAEVTARRGIARRKTADAVDPFAIKWQAIRIDWRGGQANAVIVKIRLSGSMLGSWVPRPPPVRLRGHR